LQEGFGSSVSLKAANSFRNGFQNIGEFSTRNNTLKDDILHSGLKLWEFDIFWNGRDKYRLAPCIRA
jgi:hypothetical protein